MSEPFERTGRALAAESGRLALAGLVLALLIALLWLVWLVFGRVALVVEIRDLRPTPGQGYSAIADQSAAARLRSGQRVSLVPSPNTSGDPAPPLTGRITRVDPGSGAIQLDLGRPQQPLDESAVWVITEQVSPVGLLGRMIERLGTAQ